MQEFQSMRTDDISKIFTSTREKGALASIIIIDSTKRIVHLAVFNPFGTTESFETLLVFTLINSIQRTIKTCGYSKSFMLNVQICRLVANQILLYFNFDFNATQSKVVSKHNL